MAESSLAAYPPQGCAYFVFSSLLSLAESLRAGMCGCVVCQRKGTLIGKLIYSGHKWRMGFGTLRLNHEPNGSHLGCVGSWRLTPPRLLWKN